MVDISFTGGSVQITAPIVGTTTITEFSDDGTPVQVDRIEVTGSNVNMNGTLIRWRKASAYTVTVSVIAGSENDTTLTKLLEASHVRPTGGGVVATAIADLNTTMTIMAPQLNQSFDNGGTASGNCRKWTLSEGTIVGGDPAVATDAEGKMQSKQFSFVFERMTSDDGNGKALSAGSTTVG